MRAPAIFLALVLTTSAARAEPEPPPKPPETPVKLSGYVQVDWVVDRQSSQDEVNWSTGQPLNENRFMLRRAHLRAESERGLLSAALEIDANTVNGPIVRPIDAEVSLRWPERKREGAPFVMATMGLMRIPFGFEVQELDNQRPFLERAAVLRALFPGEFDLGARIRGEVGALTYALAIMNGDPIGERAFPGRDPSKSKDMVGRLGVKSTIADGVRFEAGFSGVTGSGFHEGTPPTKDVLVWRDVNEDGIVQSTEIQVIPGSAATPSQTFHRFGIGGDVQLFVRVPHLGELALLAEIVWANNLDRGTWFADPVSAGRDVREFGWYVGATQEIGPYAIVGVRYDRYAPDADATAQRAANLVPKDASFSTLALMAGARYERGRLILEYDKNGNALGLATSGAPTTLADDAITLRGEVSF
jgi:hypothetical protein